jgi:hypothetical protein
MHTPKAFPPPRKDVIGGVKFVNPPKRVADWVLSASGAEPLKQTLLNYALKVCLEATGDFL